MSTFLSTLKSASSIIQRDVAILILGGFTLLFAKKKELSIFQNKLCSGPDNPKRIQREYKNQMHDVCESHHELFLLMTQGGSGPLIAGLAHLWVGPYLIFVVGDKYEVGSGQKSDNLCQKLIAWMNQIEEVGISNTINMNC